MGRATSSASVFDGRGRRVRRFGAPRLLEQRRRRPRGRPLRRTFGVLARTGRRGRSRRNIPPSGPTTRGRRASGFVRGGRFHIQNRTGSRGGRVGSCLGRAHLRGSRRGGPRHGGRSRLDGSCLRRAHLRGSRRGGPRRRGRSGVSTGRSRWAGRRPRGRAPSPSAGGGEPRAESRTRGATARSASCCDSGLPDASARATRSSSCTSPAARAARAPSSAARTSASSPFTVDRRAKSLCARKRKGATSGWR